jgi:hypothetical protein
VTKTTVMFVNIQIVMFRTIRVDHTNCLEVDFKTHSLNVCQP